MIEKPNKKKKLKHPNLNDNQIKYYQKRQSY